MNSRRDMNRCTD